MNTTTELTHIKGVGPKSAEQLRAAGLVTVGDLIDFLPRRHEDFSHLTAIAKVAPGKVTVKAHCESVQTRIVRRALRITTATLIDESGKLQAVWFNQPYRATQLANNKLEFYFSGEFELNNGRYQLMNPSAELVKEMQISAGRIMPVYRAIKGLKSQLVRKILAELRPLITMLPETLPPEIVASEHLMSRADALLAQHFPASAEDIVRSRERLAYEELFQLLLASQLNRDENTRLEGYRVPFEQSVVKAFVAQLPFDLTGAQRRSAWEILQDFERAVPMNRLLQGDVGSGKTVVAGLAARQAASHGYQTALMAPTEILANQHAETLHTLLAPFDVSVALLTGSVKGKARATLLAQVAAGEVDVVVGTHALFQKSVEFGRLGFVVIDEQHRFGVEQRQKLLAKSMKSPVETGLPEPSYSPKESGAARPESLDAAAGIVNGDERQLSVGLAPHLLAKTRSADLSLSSSSCDARESGLSGPESRDVAASIVNDSESNKSALLPHLLAMTATPIPRSLALTVYGELDISILDELPKNRQPITTELVSPNSRAQVYAAIDAQLAAGRQAYIVCTLIDDNPDNEQKSVEAEYKKLSTSIFKHRQIGLLHGKLAPAEKDAVMADFKCGKYDILVSTTVVEVGVDVPNASVMLIENADHFGLSQLHQLRGRVGRGQHQSYCYLMMSDSKRPTQRLREISRSQDGFYLAEVDLKLRGPGEIYGHAQHGALNLRIATLADTALIARAKRAAEQFVGSAQNLLQYKELAAQVDYYRRLTTLN